ncbi:hypothetical protein EV361DRAFT_992060 [Lentinula raphanica]|nr:hypothetical protein EV361DRAFT_992060 [Lentinula raphanica]
MLIFRATYLILLLHSLVLAAPLQADGIDTTSLAHQSPHPGDGRKHVPRCFEVWFAQTALPKGKGVRPDSIPREAREAVWSTIESHGLAENFEGTIKYLDSYIEPSPEKREFTFRVKSVFDQSESDKFSVVRAQAASSSSQAATVGTRGSHVAEAAIPGSHHNAAQSLPGRVFWFPTRTGGEPKIPPMPPAFEPYVPPEVDTAVRNMLAHQFGMRVNERIHYLNDYRSSGQRVTFSTLWGEFRNIDPITRTFVALQVPSHCDVWFARQATLPDSPTVDPPVSAEFLNLKAAVQRTLVVEFGAHPAKVDYLDYSLPAASKSSRDGTFVFRVNAVFQDRNETRLLKANLPP